MFLCVPPSFKMEALCEAERMRQGAEPRAVGRAPRAQSSQVKGADVNAVDNCGSLA